MEAEKPCTQGIACGCIGYAYVPIQKLTTIYENADTALSRGTIFPDLDLSICEYGSVCKKQGGCA